MNDDSAIRNMFHQLLPHYFALSGDLPADTKLALAVNRWPSIPIACMDLAKMPKDKRLCRDLSRELTHMQSFGRPECPDT